MTTLTPVAVEHGEIVNGSGPAKVYRCDPCQQTFPNAQGLGAHRRHKHPNRADPTPPPRAQPKPERVPEAPTKPAAADPWLLVVGPLDVGSAPASALVLSTKNDATQVAALLAELGHQALAFRLADAKS